VDYERLNGLHLTQAQTNLRRRLAYSRVFDWAAFDRSATRLVRTIWWIWLITRMVAERLSQPGALPRFLSPHDDKTARVRGGAMIV